LNWVAVHNKKLNDKRLVLAFILLQYLINGVFYLRAQSLTFDETSHLSYATRLLKGHPERVDQMDNSKMPITVINLIPRICSQILNPGLKKTDYGASDVFVGRYITLLVSVFTILLVYYWAKEIYGYRAGLFSAFLISVCPNMIANSGLVTTDSYSMLFLALTFYSLWKFCNYPGIKHFVFFSLVVAVSQLVKQSLFHLYVLLPIVIAIYFLIYKPRINFSNLVSYLILFFFINWVVINLGYGFRDTNTELGHFRFYSNSFQHLQEIFPSRIPIPLPKAFITGLDLSKYYDQIGGGDYVKSTFSDITILGRSSKGGSFWYYYFVSLLFKTPIASLLFMFSGIVLIAKKRTAAVFFKNEFFLFAPVIYFIVFMSFFYKTQIGIRQMIFIYPFLYVICGALFYWLNAKQIKIFVIAGCVFLVISILPYWRNYYPYTNELIADKKMAYKYVGCGNLEFNQSKFFYSAFLDAHPEVQMAPVKPAPGIFLIGLNDYLDVWNLHHYAWLSRFRPVGEVAYNGLLIRVTGEDLKTVSNPNPK
jgi:Dolichyl-phosphate-mannose-protein mannosyltransferase